MWLRGSAAVLAFCVMAILAVGRTGAAAPTRLIVVQNEDANTLDPFNDGVNVGLGIGRAFYNGLFGFDATMKVRPVLVTTWAVSADGLMYTFHLRQGVTFQDGTPFNAAAVKANFDRVLNPANHIQKYGLYHTVSGIAQVTVVNDSTVQMQLAHPSATLINNLAHPSDGIISPAALVKYGNQGIATHPVGTGPFVFESWTRGDRIVAKKNPHYWQPGLPAVDEIVFRDVPDSTQALAMLKTGEAQFVYPLDPVNVKSLAGQAGVRVSSTPSIFETCLLMNEHYAPFSKRNVRLAMNYAVNKQALISTLYLGYAREMRSVVGSQLDGYAPVGTYPFDPAKGKQLLAESGYPNGFTATLWLPNDTFSQKEGVFLQQQFSQIGVRVTVVPMESGTYDTNLYLGPDKSTSQLILFGFSPSNGATDWALRANFATAAWTPALFNASFYSSPKVDALFAQADRTTSTAQRNVYYKKIQMIIFSDAPWVWLGEPLDIAGISTRVSNADVLPDQTVQVQDARMH
ncbi:MAG TPA: ABC transporter substrate-binding protein [bacterium]|nr:ABC transporter substrate-binding protein [bacterium]